VTLIQYHERNFVTDYIRLSCSDYYHETQILAPREAKIKETVLKAVFVGKPLSRKTFGKPRRRPYTEVRIVTCISDYTRGLDW
jgi:hypothetical protein